MISLSPPGKLSEALSVGMRAGMLEHAGDADAAQLLALAPPRACAC